MAYEYSPRRPQCCCGQQDCAFLAHTCQTLEGLERDVRTAAELGQALAARHEAFIADAEAERKRMSSSIERLEQEKRDLEVQNATTIEENRYLLNQLESLNSTIAESDIHIDTLQDTLRATQEELHRLTLLAARAEVLEKQLWQLETDQQELQEKLKNTEEDERSAVQRWKQAERTIASLHDQIERIEREAREETERHAEVVERMEKKSAVERELQANGGKLRPIATPSRPAHARQGSGVVTHFVKDILQDNANLQAGIMELRELLLSSNGEVERLREQLMVHQPVHQLIEEDESAPPTPSLMEELEAKKAKAPELHVHHHYHAPTPGSSKARTPIQLRRPKKKRYATPPSVYHTARSSIASIGSVRGEPTTPSSEAAILSNTGVSIPIRHKPRWSMQSGISTASSLPSSPYSEYRRTSSIFDRGLSDTGAESSRPTSAGSTECGSPMFEPTEPLGLPPFPARSKSTPVGPQLKARASLPSVTVNNNFFNIDEEPLANEPELTDRASTISPSVIPEEPEDVDTSIAPTVVSDLSSPDFFPSSFSNNRLRRANSHDSLLSISGMDIHTLKSRPSQLLTATARLASNPVLSATTATAAVGRPSAVRRNDGNSLQTLKGSLLAGNAVDQRSSSSSGSKKGWGWGWSKWISNAPATVETTNAVAAARPRPEHARKPSTASARSADSITKTGKEVPVRKVRPPGINQPGAIFGLGPEPPTPYRLMPDIIDEEALREGLLER